MLAVRSDVGTLARRMLRFVAASLLGIVLWTPIARAQDVGLEGPLAGSAPAVERTPDWTWAVLGTGIALVGVSLGTGLGATLIQLDLDQVCDITCPSRVEGLQREGRVLAITTDVLWMSGVVVAAFGLVAALTLREPVAMSAACDEHGCLANVGGRF